MQVWVSHIPERTILPCNGAGNVQTRKKECAEEDERASVLCSCVTCMPGALGIAGDHHARAAETTEPLLPKVKIVAVENEDTRSDCSRLWEMKSNNWLPLCGLMVH